MWRLFPSESDRKPQTENAHETKTVPGQEEPDQGLEPMFLHSVTSSLFASQDRFIHIIKVYLLKGLTQLNASFPSEPIQRFFYKNFEVSHQSMSQ